MRFSALLLPLVLSLRDEECPAKLVWVSDATTRVFSERYRASVVLTSQGSNPPIPDTSYIWESVLESYGYFTFVKLFPLMESLKDSLQQVTIQVKADDAFSITLNGVMVVGMHGTYEDAPADYDLTQFVRFSSEASPTFNRLEITVYNKSGPGYLLYRLEAQFDKCPKSISLGSDANTYVFAERYRPSAIIANPHGEWKSIPDASWIWESDSQSYGTYVFASVFPIAERFRSAVAKASVWVICDDYCSIRMNGQTVVEKYGVWNAEAKEFDLTPFVRYSSDASPTSNKLELLATNEDSQGGLIFKVVVTFKTGRNLQDTNSTVTPAEGW